MFRNFIIKQLTQSSTWFGLGFILVALFLPRSWILFAGALVMITDDAKMQTFFTGMRKEIELLWKP